MRNARLLILAALLSACTSEPYPLVCTKAESKSEEWDRFVELCYAQSKWMSDIHWCKHKAANMGYGTCTQERP